MGVWWADDCRGQYIHLANYEANISSLAKRQHSFSCWHQGHMFPAIASVDRLLGENCTREWIVDSPIGEF